MFSNYYILHKDVSLKREAGKMAIMRKIAAKKSVRIEKTELSEDEDVIHEESDESSGSDES